MTNQRLQRGVTILAGLTALIAPGSAAMGPGATAALADTRAMTTALRSAIASCPPAGKHGALIETHRGVALFVTTLESLSGPPFVGPCDDPARLYLSTGTMLNETVQITLSTDFGADQFTFASGASQLAILAALNAEAEAIGVSAAAAPANPQRIELITKSRGVTAFISVEHVSSAAPRVFEQPIGGLGATALLDQGEAGRTGDLNCDDTVNVLDLLLVLQSWGPCPVDDACPADLNGDHVVNVLDLISLLGKWG